MNEYVILVGLTTNVDLGNDADRERNRRLHAIYDLAFSLGPAWHGNQGSVLLRSEKTQQQIVDLISPLVGESDLVAVMRVTTHALTSIGYNADEEGLDVVYSNAVKLGVSPSGGTYAIS